MAKLVKSKVFKRDESNIRICPAWVIYSMPFVMLGMVISIVCAIVYQSVLWCVGYTILLFWSIFSDKYFSMYENCKIEFKEDCVVYSYDLNRSVMPSSDVTTRLYITKISKIKVKRNTLILKGCIVRKAPLKQQREKGKISVPINFTEREEIISLLKERMVSNG